MAKGNILIVDDNKSILSALEILLTPEFQTVTTLSDPYADSNRTAEERI